jgi:hypothetical protein
MDIITHMRTQIEKSQRDKELKSVILEMLFTLGIHNYFFISP